MPKNINDARHRRRDAVFSAVESAIFLLLFGGFLLWVRQRAFPAGGLFYGVLTLWAAMQAVLLIPLAITLKKRFDEIQGGEEDEARQY